MSVIVIHANPKGKQNSRAPLPLLLDVGIVFLYLSPHLLPVVDVCVGVKGRQRRSVVSV